ncbi:MAG: tRNA lysidine(34) synthetase TilS [Candidatus Eremiobacteraeota bacterium]|nr:tRNA lysidine(34) synthetase TilS [Candidatus Eremiobacteraeota bacterium]
MRGAHGERDIERSIREGEAIRRGDRVLVACSGGPDSVALAAALHALAPAMALEVRLAYVNHGTRASAAQDECVVASVAATFALPFETARLTTQRRDEASMREARYAALTTCAGRTGSTVIATAHHAEDQAETVLLALFRGAGPDGMAGMRPRRALTGGIDLARPLLHVSTETLRHACHVRALPYAIDPANADASLRRNAVRGALDALRPLFPGLDEAVARAATLVGDRAEAPQRAALRQHVRACLAQQAELCDIAFAHVEQAVRALESGGSGTFWMKPGVRLEILHGDITGITKG